MCHISTVVHSFKNINMRQAVFSALPKPTAQRVRKPRVRYVCYGKTRKITPCEGQSAYIQHKLDSMVEKVVKEIFERIKGVPKSAIINSRYKEELAVREANSKRLQSEYAKELE